MSSTHSRADGIAVEPTSITTSSGEPDDVKKLANNIEATNRARSPPPGYPVAEASSSSPSSPRPPPFSSLYTSTADAVQAYKASVNETVAAGSTSVPAYAPVATVEFQTPLDPTSPPQDVQAETKAALPLDTKGESSKKDKDEDSEPPPAYEEGSSPLDSFTYLMAAAGGAASIITQVQQGGPAPINTLGGRLYRLTLQVLGLMGHCRCRCR